MKVLGIVRQISGAGQITIPKEIRRVMGIKPKQSMEIFATEEGIFIRPYESRKRNERFSL